MCWKQLNTYMDNLSPFLPIEINHPSLLPNEIIHPSLLPNEIIHPSLLPNEIIHLVFYNVMIFTNPANYVTPLLYIEPTSSYFNIFLYSVQTNRYLAHGE